IDRIVRHREPELLMQPHNQIARPPAHHAMDRSDRALLYDPGEKGLMYSVELGRTASLNPDRWGEVRQAAKILMTRSIARRYLVLLIRCPVSHAINRKLPASLAARLAGETKQSSGGSHVG